MIRTSAAQKIRQTVTPPVYRSKVKFVGRCAAYSGWCERKVAQLNTETLQDRFLMALRQGGTGLITISHF